MGLRKLGLVVLTAALMSLGVAPAHASDPIEWSEPVAISAPDWIGGTYQIVAAPNNTLTALLSSNVNGDAIIQARTSDDHGATWSAAVDVAIAGKTDSYGLGLRSLHQALVVTPNNSLYAFFDDGLGTFQSSSSNDGGATWSDARVVPHLTAQSEGATFTAMPDNSVLTVWNQYDSEGKNTILVSNLSSSGESSGEPIDITKFRETILGISASVAVTPDGHCILVWRLASGGVLRASLSADMGATWSSPSGLDQLTNENDAFAVVASADNSLTLVFGTDPGAYFTSTSTNYGVSWSRGEPITGIGQTAYFWKIIPSGVNTLTVFSDGITKVTNSPYVSAQASSSTDHGLSWSSPLSIPSIAFVDANYSSVAISPDGIFTVLSNGKTPNDAPAILSAYTLTAPVGTSAPLITSPAPIVAVVGEPYSFQITVTGSPIPSLKVSSGDLPDGLTLSSDGLLSGTPTQSGEFSFSITASNGTASDAVADYALSPRGGDVTPVESDSNFFQDNAIAIIAISVLLIVILGVVLTLLLRSRSTNNEGE